MNKDELLTLSNALKDPDTLQTISLILTKLGAFERGLNRNASDKETFMTLGKREKGSWLLDMVYQADKGKYMEILEIREKEKNNV